MVGTHVRPPPVELDDGDLVFRTGRDVIGQLVLNYGERPRFSHVGMVVRMDDETLVVHALPRDRGKDGGVRVERLGAFISPLRASDVGYFRPWDLSGSQRDDIRQFLLERVGTPFDYRFDYSGDDALYCTELVLKALAQVGVDLSRSIGTVRVMTLDEPAFAPDSLRQAVELREMVVMAR